MTSGRFSIASSSILIIGSILFAFVCIKASMISFTHDESYTYLHFPHDSFMEILSYSNWFNNNHLLNTLFMKYSEQLFGNSEWALRLPNLLLLLIYMTYSFLLFRKKNALLSISVFVLLCTNSFLMDLFGLARGYGMACGFMVMSLYYFMAYIDNYKRINLVLFHASALLACLSSFTLLPFYLALIAVYFIMGYLESRFNGRNWFGLFKSNWKDIIPLLVSLVILYEPVRRVMKFNDFDNGGKSGFFEDTVAHLIQNTFHGVQFQSISLLILQLLFTGIFFISFIIIIRKLREGSKEFYTQFKGLIASNFLLLFIALVLIALHVILGTDYPISRFSIFLFPIFSIHLGFLAHYFLSIGYKKIVLTIVCSLALISASSFGIKANLKSSSQWGYDQATKSMMVNLESDYNNDKAHPETIKLGINWLFEPTINFYRETMEIDWLLPVNREGIEGDYDYYYVFNEELDQLGTTDYDIVFEYEGAKTYLLKNKDALISK